MLSVETFDTIQARREEMAGQAYKPRQLDWSDERFLTADTHAIGSRFLRRLGQVSGRLLTPGMESAKLPPEEAWYNATYTSQNPTFKLEDETGQSLSMFLVRKRPVDMGDFAVDRMVLSDSTEAEVSLLDEVPLTVVWIRPMGAVAVESPLLYNPDARYAWQHIVGQVLDELEAGLQTGATGS